MSWIINHHISARRLIMNKIETYSSRLQMKNFDVCFMMQMYVCYINNCICENVVCNGC